MLESALEQMFFERVRAAGGLAIKLMPTHAGVPDRLVLWPDGSAALVELKTVTGSVSKVQRLWHDRAAALGHPVTVLYGKEQIKAWVADR